jgi:arylsulfatase A-like enzyme
MNTPNLIIIVLDSVRRDHLSCYDYSRRTTPHIDRLAEEAVLFRDAYSTSCWTIPAHASLFTGLYPSHHGVNDLEAEFRPDQLTLAGYLSDRGYRTAAISCNGFISRYTNLGRAFQFSVDVSALRGATRGMVPRAVRAAHGIWREKTARDRGAARATKLALRWLNEQENGQPFLLFMNYMDCHAPYRLRRPDRLRFLEGDAGARADAVAQDPFAVIAGELALTELELSDLEALYDGSLYYLDRHVGTLLAHLKRSRLSESTALILTSDHGESFGEHGLMDHQYGLFEHLIGIPFIMRLPAGELGGKVSLDPVQLTDVLPTIASWIDGRSSHSELNLDGQPLLDSPPREAVLTEYLVPNLRTIRRRFPLADVRELDVALRSIRVRSQKLILASNGARQLYDVQADPAEGRDLASVNPEAVGVLEKRLVAALGDWPGPRADVDGAGDGLREVRDRLEALGYL